MKVQSQIIDFDKVFAEFKKFNCDGSCNGNSDVCTHIFQWHCRQCLELQTMNGEDMPAADNYNGRCPVCLVNPVLIECGNCDQDFPQGAGTEGDLFCSNHCRQRFHGELCGGDCPACADGDLI